jgi:uncharacterized protein (TIGR02266 family)
MTTERKPRFSTVQFDVVYDDGEGFMSAKVLDLSESGVFLETVMPLSPGTRVRMTPLLPEETGLFELDGEVVRKEDYDDGRMMERPAGMGIRFLDVSAQQLDRLLRLLDTARARAEAAD